MPAQKSLRRKKRAESDLDATTWLDKAIQAYYASITFADAQVGRSGLDAASPRSGLAERQHIVVFTSDHGYHMGEHNHYQKTTLFENADRVPLIISVPGSEHRGASSQAFAEMIDFYPTLADLCEVDAPKNLSGVSLKPTLDDPKARPRDSALTQYATGYTLRTDSHRYTEWAPTASKASSCTTCEATPRN